MSRAVLPWSKKMHFLESERIHLRTIQKRDMDGVLAAQMALEESMLTGEVYPPTEQGLERLYAAGQETEKRIWFLIIAKETGKAIGETGFLRIYPPWRTADFSLVIWDAAQRGKGLGKEVGALMLRYGFDQLNYHRIAIGVVAQNERALRFWKSLGFRQEGLQREGFYKDGAYSDFVMMSLLENEYRGKL